ncbi:GpE family phage tail protein [Modicisalibacter ilicicola]|nr:GpE family phage tail protein [Halomonas ilicicola]
MADLAMVFHWRPEDMAAMPLTELMEWRERARIRSQTDQPTR